jgi:hypothetical protein
LKPIVKQSVLTAILCLAFILTALFSIYASTRVITVVNHSNIKLEFLLKDLRSKGYATRGLALQSSNAAQLWSESDLYSTLQDKKVTEVYFEEARYDFPFGLYYSKIWFTVDDISYFLVVA